MPTISGIEGQIARRSGNESHHYPAQDKAEGRSVAELVEASASLEIGWFVALLGSLTMIGAGLYETFRRHRA